MEAVERCFGGFLFCFTEQGETYCSVIEKRNTSETQVQNDEKHCKRNLIMIKWKKNNGIDVMTKEECEWLSVIRNYGNCLSTVI